MRSFTCRARLTQRIPSHASSEAQQESQASVSELMTTGGNEREALPEEEEDDDEELYMPSKDEYEQYEDLSEIMDHDDPKISALLEQKVNTSERQRSSWGWGRRRRRRRYVAPRRRIP